MLMNISISVIFQNMLLLEKFDEHFLIRYSLKYAFVIHILPKY